MERTQPLNHSSPIVQRVLRVRERLAWPDTTAEKGSHGSASADIAQCRTRYQWQMWQKSDFSAYAGDELGHRCKETPLSSGREDDSCQLQQIPVLSQRLAS